MTSVLNVGVMPSNPVGNQIRNLQGQLDSARNEIRTLLLALETKAPETFAEYVRLKEEAQERIESANRMQQTGGFGGPQFSTQFNQPQQFNNQQQQQQPQQPQFNQFNPQQRPLFQPSQPARGASGGGRF